MPGWSDVVASKIGRLNLALTLGDHRGLHFLGDARHDEPELTLGRAATATGGDDVPAVAVFALFESQSPAVRRETGDHQSLAATRVPNQLQCLPRCDGAMGGNGVIELFEDRLSFDDRCLGVRIVEVFDADPNRNAGRERLRQRRRIERRRRGRRLVALVHADTLAYFCESNETDDMHGRFTSSPLAHRARAITRTRAHRLRVRVRSERVEPRDDHRRECEAASREEPPATEDRARAFSLSGRHGGRRRAGRARVAARLAGHARTAHQDASARHVKALANAWDTAARGAPGWASE